MNKIISHLHRWARNAFSNVKFHWNRIIYRKLIIESEYGGLGDHLLLSHIPRIAKESGRYKKVFISNKSVFRDPACRELIWGSNPHVDGFVDERGYVILPPPTQPKANNKLFELLFKYGLENRITHLTENCNLLDQFMISYGLDDGFRFHEPEIYHNIQKTEGLNGITIYDPNYVTNVGVLSVNTLEDYFRKNEIIIQAQMALRNNSLAINKSAQTITTKNLLDFCSVIISCKELYCLTTGTATLAAALKKPSTVLYGGGVNCLYHHSRLHNYVKL